MYLFAAGLSGRSGQIGSDDVGGVPVQRCPCPVVPHGGARVGMRGSWHVREALCRSGLRG
jgi:hypothetical protein